MSREWRFIAWGGTPTGELKDATELVRGLYDELSDRRSRLSLARGLLREARDVGTGKIEHVCMGMCPDRIEGFDTRSLECPACEVLVNLDTALGES